MNKTVYIALGSNVGCKRDNMKQAVELIAALPGTQVIKCSSLYETAPWGKTDQEEFLNQVIAVETTLQPG